jgi:hypothetical protein
MGYLQHFPTVEPAGIEPATSCLQSFRACSAELPRVAEACKSVGSQPARLLRRPSTSCAASLLPLQVEPPTRLTVLGTSRGGRVEIQLAPSFRAIRGSVPPRPVSYLLPKQNVRDEVHLLVASSSMLAKNASTPAFEPAIYSSTSSSPLAATSSSTAADTSWSNNSRPRGSSA